MKLIIAVVQNEDANDVVDALLEAEFRTTRLASTGGFLRRGNTTMMIGVEDAQVDTVIDIIRNKAHTRAQGGEGGTTVQTAAATIFVLDLEGYERL
ncbi:MAG: cyclic-di-AMP receptor [Thermomicrobiales bacterium]|jgi:uncharacterized protein YaaQ|nr:cyclic-di-AMP receptor [Thermomicrobiales bacterium]